MPQLHREAQQHLSRYIHCRILVAAESPGLRLGLEDPGQSGIAPDLIISGSRSLTRGCTPLRFSLA
jgi:hypothetical protein